MFLLSPGAANEGDAAVNLCKGMIERHGGKIMFIKKWDERKLSYEIRGQKRGTYVVAFFTAKGDAIGPIERDVKLSEQVLRVLTLQADHLNQTEMEAVEPQPIQPREERAPWDRPGFNNDGPRRGGGDRGGDRGPRRDEAEAGIGAKD